MKTFILTPQHGPAECAIAYAAWNGFDSPLRGETVQSTCARYQSRRTPGSANRPSQHEIWWTAQAIDPDSALRQLPPYVRDRTEAHEVSPVTIG
jgi:hypothetical protein